VLAAAGIYGGIARHVAADPAAALAHRVYTSKWEKLGWLLRAAAQSAARTTRYPPAQRAADLWQRPVGSI